MPSKEKVSIAQLKVGILGIVALSCVTLVVFLLTGNMHWFQKDIPLHMYTSDAAGLTKGAPVRINGIQAGKVDAVNLSGERDPAQSLRVERVGEQVDVVDGELAGLLARLERRDEVRQAAGHGSPEPEDRRLADLLHQFR